MKRYLILVLLIGLCMNSAGWADMNRQIWDTGSVNENLDGVRAFHEDKRPDMMPFDPAPDIEEVLEESWFGNRADQYYANLWGWVTIPETGTYTWHMHADNHSVLYISTDESWENVQEVASIDGWSNVGEWGGGANGGPNADSAAFQYAAGQILAVWGIMVEGGGGDNLGIGWTMPGSNSIEYISDHVSIIPPTPTKARNPMPEAGAVDVPRDTDLSWAAGKFAATHDVYLGTVFDDVNDATRADPRGVLVSESQADITYDPGILEFGATYYWRIDEVNAPPDSTIFKGKVWEFTVEPFAYAIEGIIATSNGDSDATSGPEKTVDGSGLNAAGQHSVEATDMWLATPGADPLYIQFEFDRVYKLHEMVVWNYNVMFELLLGFGLKDVTIEYSENGEDWTTLGDVTLNQATAKDDYAANTTVAFDGVPVKFVKITVNSGHGPMGQFGLSEVQFMQIPASAREPQPADGAVDVPVGTTLGWRSGREAVSHEVSLGADPNTLELVGTVNTNSFTGADLEFGMDYSWKVDEVNEADAITTWPGAVWGFRTEEYALIDGMEEYTDDEGSRIYETWVDGYGVPANGSQVGYLESPFAEGSIVNSGGQSMPLFYDNSGSAASSEATKSLGGMNLAANGADSLRLFVSGSAPTFYEGADGTILMNAIGNDIWDAADQFRFAYKQLTGDGSMIARVDDLDGSPSSWAKAGVMIRQDTAVGSTHSFMCMTGGDGNGASWQGRETANANSVNADATSPVAPPYWVRIDRAGDTLTGYLSPDGETWTQLGDPRTIEMDDPVLIGLAVTSHNTGQSTGAAFSNVSITGAAGAFEIAEIGVAQPQGNDPAAVYVKLGNSRVTLSDAAATARSGWTEYVIPLSEFGGVTNVQEITVGVEGPGAGLIFIDDVGFGRAYVAP